MNRLPRLTCKVKPHQYFDGDYRRNGSPKLRPRESDSRITRSRNVIVAS